MILIKQFKKDGYARRVDVGKDYEIITSEASKDTFDKLAWAELGVLSDLCHGFIVFNAGKEIEPLFKLQSTYLLNDNGDLFEDLSFKKS